MSLIICLHNISDLAAISDYEYWVRVGDGSVERSNQIAAGKITGHKRSDGWKALVQRVIDESKG